MEFHCFEGPILWPISKSRYIFLPFRVSWQYWCIHCYRWECKTCCACSTLANSYQWRRYWIWMLLKDVIYPRLHPILDFIWEQSGNVLYLFDQSWSICWSMFWNGRKGPSKLLLSRKCFPARNLENRIFCNVAPYLGVHLHLERDLAVSFERVTCNCGLPSQSSRISSGIGP